ncbi:hypothetical protein H1R20_g12632, partial [Candolleomyces eurysporus]
MTYSCAIFPDLDGDLNPTYRTKGSLKDRIPNRPLTRPYQLPSPPSSESFNSTSSSNSTPSIPLIPLENSSSNVNEALIAKLTTSEDLLRRDENSSTSTLEIPTDSNEVDTEEDPSSDELHDAQLRKLDYIIAKLKISSNKPTRVLEIGSGWGSMAIRIAERYPLATIDTLTLSVQQQELARERIRSHSAVQRQGGDLIRTNGQSSPPESGMEERIRVHLMDYRAMPPDWKGAFDRVVSVEMIEAVGKEFLEEYWRVVDWAMKEKEAVGVVQVITIPEAIFPGGLLPTLTLLLQSLTAGSNGRLVVDSVSNIGPHYSRTLREWRRQFVGKFESVIRPALVKEYPEVMGGQDADANKEIEVFKRKWIYYYCYCEVGFTTRTLGDHIIAFAREGYEDYGCSIFH